ncbi:PDDEXK nuclease domain-containing protein [Oerskovia sp. M15]
MTELDSPDQYSVELVEHASELIEQGRTAAVRQANYALTLTFWRLGQLVADEVGSERAGYGQETVATLGRQLAARYGRGFEEKNLRRMVQFAQAFPDEQIVATLGRRLSWSHFKVLLPVKSAEARDYYVAQAIAGSLSVRALRDLIGRKGFERREIANAQTPAGSMLPLDTFRDPYFLDFLGLTGAYQERDLEQAIIRELEPFLLEIGHGWTFVARQKRMTVDGDDFYLDLLFYARPLRRLVAVELKIGHFRPAFEGQMKLYLKWLDRFDRQPGEEAPIGLILCTEASREQIELLEMHKDGIAVAEYWTALPPKAELESRIREIYAAAREQVGGVRSRLNKKAVSLTMSDLTDHLRRAFAERDVVVWHDPERQYAEDLDGLDLGGVAVLQVRGDEFGIKNRVLRREAREKFLVYRGGPVPDGVGNWLLDVELAYGVFSADRGTLLAQDLGLTGSNVVELLRGHEGFFRSTKRTEALQALLSPDDEALDGQRKADRLRAKMCAVVLGQREHTLQEIARRLLIESAEGSQAGVDALTGQGLDGFFYEGAQRIYGYASSAMSVDDFVVWLFQQAAAGFVGSTSAIGNLERDFASWRFDTRSSAAMAVLARRAGKDLGISEQIAQRDYRDLLDSDVFVEYESAIVVHLAQEAAARTASARDVADVVRRRRASPWLSEWETHYEAVAAGAEVLAGVAAFSPSASSFSDALRRYRDEWFQIDQAYRRFTRAATVAEPRELLIALREAVERAYTTAFILPSAQPGKRSSTGRLVGTRLT